jgi:SAM-dependent methyltransferase
MTSKTFAKPLSALDARFEAQKLAFGPLVFQCVRIALKWGLLESIDRAKSGLTIAELAQSHHRSEYAISVLLESWLSAGVVKSIEDRYHLEKIGHFVLRDEMTRVNFNFTQEICYLGMFELEAALSEGKPAGLKNLGEWATIYPGLSQLPEAAKTAWFEFDHHYSDSAFALVLPIVFANKPAKLMDIGANTGKWARRCLDFDKSVQLTLLDLREQLAVARVNLADEADRITFHEIDMLNPASPFPGGQDVVWMSQFLSCFSAGQIASILQRAKASLKPDGCVYILDTFWDRQRYDIAAYCIINTSPYFTALANGVSKMYQSQEYIELAASVGLRLVDIRDELGLSHSLLKFVHA